MSNAQSNESLRELNAKLLAEIAELRKKFAEIKVKNDELKDKNTEIVASSDKIVELEAERTELKTRIAGLPRQAMEENPKSHCSVIDSSQKNNQDKSKTRSSTFSKLPEAK
ncbi:802_t:CDS:2, partial [Ambispora gerdemannii]